MRTLTLPLTDREWKELKQHAAALYGRANENTINRLALQAVRGIFTPIELVAMMDQQENEGATP